MTDLVSDSEPDIDISGLEITYEDGETPALPEDFDPRTDLPLVIPVQMPTPPPE